MISVSESTFPSFLLHSFLILAFAFSLHRSWRYIQSDYKSFLSLGPGGIPSTPRGYVLTVLLRTVARGKKDVITPPPLPCTPARYPSRPYFASTTTPPSELDKVKNEDRLSLPQRAWPRPRTAGLAPHRQVTQQGSRADGDALHAALRGVAAANPTTVLTGKSCLEKHSMALFLAVGLGPDSVDLSPMGGFHRRRSRSPDGEEQKLNASCGGPTRGGWEFAHMHGSDGSLHLALAPEDVGAVIRAGWGERHPLAGRTLGSGFVMVYAPHNSEELDVVMRIVRAGAWWVGGGSVELSA